VTAPNPNYISEDPIKRALVQKLQHLHGFDSLACHTEDPEDNDDTIHARIGLQTEGHKRNVLSMKAQKYPSVGVQFPHKLMPTLNVIAIRLPAR
jgi:hypothetical protein